MQKEWESTLKHVTIMIYMWNPEDTQQKTEYSNIWSKKKCIYEKMSMA